MNNKLVEFVIKQSAVKDEEITLKTKIEEDLGVSGDDASEFMFEYAKTFNVDVTEFMLDEYFSPEGPFLWTDLLHFFLGKPKPHKKELTVEHLEKGILAGKLNNEIISN